ncbi:diaminopimelate epimerase [Tissierella sp. Yu-01]|uniref:diaminopimelate epimerase n=1 Tax=Tissierella sp. Yu-01 TaxID=3035694 RepID=UPI00240D203C|nr:diaminopimelate epimerase [Tissierella sp. Yu-01]WFA08818.1 diaminopimelate epimerase [Tissierella sp. Yu-01]
MEFTKIQGVGNDFIIINNMELKLPVNNLSYIANKLCKRKLSVGADGLMVVDYPDGDANFKMRFLNSDGSIGEMCGNGARCIARYAYINNIAPKSMTFETLAGLVSAEILENRIVKVRLNNPEIIELEMDINIDDNIYKCSYIELGNPGLPHLVVNYPGLRNTKESEILELGRSLRYYKKLPKGANVNFYDVLDMNTVVVKTYERGVEDFTLGCGSGSGATAIVLILLNYLKNNKVKILVPGGELFIEVERNEKTIEKLYLIGETNIIAVGQILDEDLIT